MGLAVALGAWTADAPAIDFTGDLDAALRENSARLPIVVSFSADWCGFCQKMKADTFRDPAVMELAGKFLWVKIDVDDQPGTAARFGALSVPKVVVLSDKGRILAARGGYLPPREFVELLNRALSDPQPLPAEDAASALAKAAAATTNDDVRAAIPVLAEALARPERYCRDELLAALSKSGAKAWPSLVELLGDERLAVRAAAASALKDTSMAELPFNPFAPASQRAVEQAAWRAWVAEHRR